MSMNDFAAILGAFCHDAAEAMGPINKAFERLEPMKYEFYCPMCDGVWIDEYEDGIKHLCLNSRD